jgi:hypothetical protein
MWETLERAIGTGTRTGVSAAWRCSARRKNPVLVVSLSNATLRQLGLDAPGTRCVVERNRPANQLRIRLAEPGTPALQHRAIHRHNAVGVVEVPLPDVTSPPRSAEPCPHEIEDGALTFDLPGWARVPQTGRAIALVESAPQPPAPPPAAPPAAVKPKPPGKTSKIPTPRDADPRDVLAGLDDDDLAEARAMMRSGKVGARALHEYFGWPLPQAVKIAAALRDEVAA